MVAAWWGVWHEEGNINYEKGAGYGQYRLLFMAWIWAGGSDQQTSVFSWPGARGDGPGPELPVRPAGG